MFRHAIRAARPLARTSAVRAYATEASANRLRVNLVVPHQAYLKQVEATQVNLSSTEGDMGILAEHVPTVAQLKPGVIEIFSATEKPQKFFASGGFAIINPDSTLNINAVEAFALEDIDGEAVRRAIDDATRRTNTGSEEERVIAKIELETYEAIAAAVPK
ncbi:delta subunit of the central stalk of mitochondrial F1F0 ATP synthase, atp16 [Geranomyces variabilis]|nr:F1 complex, delta/epsilon subunit of ATPase [Geranomyces variabilis]KAJ3143514.1 delta subunit of the central stalk of mitochondrial F1F0 ATP synthase, atp16 [Geranomyces variabilis]KAJ3164621.1 delta subunit of the central stalk of mitochondrial F1F0 ATP synthase, atp16 [Geranomyces variabilis]